MREVWHLLEFICCLLNEAYNWCNLYNIRCKYVKYKVGITNQTVPACKELAMVRALLMSFVNTAAAKPYVVLFARSITSFMSLNLKMDITGPNI